MVPPPSAVMHPSMQTPTQSMLRRPAARAAVIACAASATKDSKFNTISLGGRLRMATSRDGFQGSLCRGHCPEQIENGRPRRSAATRKSSRVWEHRRIPAIIITVQRRTLLMADERNPDDRFRFNLTDDGIRRQTRLE